MKLYEFICQDCKKEFEELVQRENSTIHCPNCKSENTKRLLSAVKPAQANSAQAAGNTSCSPSSGFS